MKAYVNTFGFPKEGNSFSEYEDAYWPPQSCETDFPVRLAVADGATDAVFSGLWAEILVRSWGREHVTLENVPQVLEKNAKIWNRIIRHRQLPWYVEEKARQGSYAALIAVEVCNLERSSSGSWRAIACGDCCLFQIRDQQLITAFPISKSNDFSNSPVLLTTRTMNNQEAAIQSKSGGWETGDHLYLMTDALAHWFIGKYEAGSLPWRILTDITLTRKPSFSEWISDLRKQKELKNDDCTLVSISFE